MKKFFVIFALFCAVFLISCGSDPEDETAEQPAGTSDTDKDTETDSESESSDNSLPDIYDSDETLPDNDSDAADPKKKRGELYGECYPNKTCNEGLVCDTENNICIKDESDDEDDSGDGDTTSDKDADKDGDKDKNDDKDHDDPQPDEDSGTETEPESKKCLDAGGKWEMSASGSSCTKTAKCDPIPASVAHAEWNGSDSYTQTYTDGAWEPKIPTEYSETAGECKYKCDPAYAYEDGSCINQKTADCADKPANSVWNGASSYSRVYADGAWSAEIPTEYSTAAGACTYKCEATHYYHDNQCLNPCDEEPCSTVAHAASCSASAWDKYTCKCQNGYYSNGNNECFDPCENNPCSAVTNATSCIASAWNKYTCQCKTHYTYDQSTSTCKADTQRANCSSKPANSVWNDGKTGSEIGTFVQTWNGEAWMPASYTSTYSTITGNCKYKCDSTHYPHNSQCINPCDSKPCNSMANATSNSCSASAWNKYTCKCQGVYSWDSSDLKCFIPECSRSTTLYPCKDSEKSYFWSYESDDYLTWQDAMSFCSALNNQNYGGFSSGWHLPDIGELRTLIRDCTETQYPNPSVKCLVDAYYSAKIYRINCQGCARSNEGYCLLPSYYLWSSTYVFDATDNAWYIDFQSYDDYMIDYVTKTEEYAKARCVHNVE